MSIEITLKTVLTNATSSVSAKVYPLRKALKSSLPAVVYKRISMLPHEYMGHIVGVAGLPKRERFQISCIASSYSGLNTLVGLVDGALVGNDTDFSAVQPLGSAIEDKDEDAKIYVSIKDYYIWHTT